MSIVNLSACYNLQAALSYQEGENNDRVAVSSSNISPFDFDGYARIQIESGSHKIQGYTLIQSFSLAELENNQDNAVLVNKLGCALLEKAYPGYPYKVVTHRDSKTGCLHNHCSILNYEFETGKAVTKNRRWLDLSRINDSIMTDYGMEVCNAKTRQADQKAYWDKKRNPDKYIWQEDLENRIVKALDGAISVKDFANRLAVEGVTAKIFTKDGKPLKHMSFSFMGNDGKIHKKRGSKMKLVSEPKELAAVFIENAAKHKQLVQQPPVAALPTETQTEDKAPTLAKAPKQGLTKREQAEKAAAEAEAEKKKQKAEVEAEEKRRKEKIRLHRELEEEKEQLRAELRELEEREDLDDLPQAEFDCLEQLKRQKESRLLKIIIEIGKEERADKLGKGAQLDRGLEHAYNVSRQKQRDDDDYSL